MPAQINIAIVEDDPVVLDGLVSFFTMQTSIKLLHTFGSVEKFIEWIDKSSSPFILLLDIQLPGQSGIEALPKIKTLLPELEVIILTTFEETDVIFKALSAGACSYISKRSSLPKIKEAVEVVAQGGSYMSPAIARKISDYYKPKPKSQLTERQLEIVKGIVIGKSYKMIASDLFISLDTVRSHIKNIYKALEINSKAELIRKSYDNEL
ncbi:response regulator transcription factor [Psychroflexus sp. CAK57W]|uniref:response regulator transcription factor n=1 Tax=Psychroflexus curvus TaxID=2873595 RepID=UPI001CCFDBFC|nr:response regulator transcription factor [Psychroflexus curvus]MBZ9628365.1 response regulator transcription factor [Psychroflexus curvus]MBZ9788404.1 response regulator transcription factor [Psychroflexus curvus]